MVKYFTSYPKTVFIIIILLIVIFVASLFIPYMINPSRKG
jgi:regulatory protein YycI of two-component signal transduction system YycFG